MLDSGSGSNAAAEAAVVQAFGIPASNVLSLPIKEAVAARLAHTDAADAETGFSKLEKMHAEKLVPERQALLLSAVAKEIGPLVQSARQAVAARFIATIKEMQDLTSTSGKNQSVAQDMLTRLEAERKNYQKSVAAFNVTYSDLTAKGQNCSPPCTTTASRKFSATTASSSRARGQPPACGKICRVCLATLRRRSQKSLITRENCLWPSPASIRASLQT